MTSVSVLFSFTFRCLEYTIHDKELKETKEKLDEVISKPLNLLEVSIYWTLSILLHFPNFESCHFIDPTVVLCLYLCLPLVDY